MESEAEMRKKDKNKMARQSRSKIPRYGSALFPDGPWKSATRFSLISRNVH